MAFYATLYFNEGGKSDSYQIYLSQSVMEHFNDTGWANVYANTTHVVIKASDSTDPTARRLVPTGHRSGRTVSVNRLVSDGILPKRYFGKRYKVKKDKQGNLYVCLQEPIEQKKGGKGDGN